MMTSRKTVLLALAAAASTATLVITISRLVPTAHGKLGHDYSYFFPYLLSGAQWISQNGWLRIPYFTPDYCGGIPWLPNPQSIFYSFPQFLTLLTNPVTAIYWTVITFATVGAAASYGLLRKCFGASWQAAGLAFVLFQLNGFLLFRIAIGHLTYHIFGLIPVLCLLVLLPAAEDGSAQIKVMRRAGAMIVGGVVLAMMVYAGATNFIIPASLSVVAVLLVHQARIGWQLAPWCALVGAGLWAIPLSAIKLFPALIFVSSYPRLHIWLFNSPTTLAKVLLESFFAPGFLPDYIRGLGVHEYEYGVSIIPLLCIFSAVLLYALTPSRPQHPFAWIGLVLVIALPIALTIGNEAWGRTLLKIPIINNNAVFLRWWSIYITPLIVVACLSFDRVVPDTRIRDVVLSGSILIVVAQLILRDLRYYENQPYDPIPIIAAVGRVVAGIPLPEIAQVGTPPRDQAAPNDGLIWGVSAYPCYEPLFEYNGLGLFPASKLQPGPVKSEIDGHFNLVDPRCYLSSGKGTCPAGALFQWDERSDVAKFTSHRPLPWQPPLWKSFAEEATMIAAVISALALLAFVIR
jgi:hypothetical protein